MKKFYGIVLIVLLMTGMSFGQFAKLWEMNVGTHAWFANDNTARGMDINPVTNHILVVSRTGGHAIYVLNSLTGTVLDTMDMTGVTGGTAVLNIVRVANDGVIYACNLVLDNQILKIYRWSNETAAPTVAFEGTVTKRAGDAFNLTGTGVNTKLYVSGSANPAIEVFSTTDGLVFTKGTAITLPGAGYARGGISPIADNQEGGFWVNGAGTEAAHIDGNGTLINALSGTVASSGWQNIEYFERAGKKYVALVGKNLPADGLQVKIFDVTESEKFPKHFLTFSLSNVYSANTNAAGDVKVVINPNDDSFIIYQLVTNNGIAAYKTNLMTIAQAREDLNGDNKPDRLNDTLTVYGVVYTPNYLASSSDLSYYMSDGTAAVNLYINYPSGATPKALSSGDSVMVVGKIAQFRGLTELDAMAEANITVLKDSAVIPAAVEVTLAQFKAAPESYESKLLLIRNLSKAGTDAWPLAAADANLKVTDGTDTLIYRIDKDTDVDGSPEPTWPRDLMGVITQYTSTSSVFNDGYQLQPRATTDIIAPVPVELLSFNSKVSGNDVKLSWQTATETNNMGFELYRNNVKVKFVPGYGTTAEKKSYTFEDKDLNAGKYTYRLVQVDYSGVKETVGNVEVEVSAAPAVFGLNQNYPNPFNPSTVIAFSIPVDAKVSLKIMNIIGEEVADIVNSNLSSGQHQVTFNASHLNSGIYFYSIQANGVDGSKYSSTRKMLLIK